MFKHGDRKSPLLLIKLWESLATLSRYRPYVTKLDLKEFRKRATEEGLPFMTTILPRLGKMLDCIHSKSEYVLHGFKCRDGLPLFLGKAMSAAISGDSKAVDCVRQLSYVFYKLEVAYDQETVSDFIHQFEKIDEQVGTHNFGPSKDLIARARKVIGRILCNFDPLDIRPNHGSGVTACRTANHEKWIKLRYYSDLDQVFSYPEFFFYSATHLADEYQKLLESEHALPQARLCVVPKDSRGPRLISCEPAELMYIQQGLMRKLYTILETHPITRGYVNFTDQTVNRSLARESSKTGSYATIDLSEASDRVSHKLVEMLFPSNWMRCFDACRSTGTLLPDGRVMRFNKFAPMGSACCFPVEALVFFAIALAATHEGCKPYVYGDDIIVEADKASLVMDALETVGLKNNREKCYLEGPFRESCGGDYHNFYDVTPVRLRKYLGTSNTSIATDTDLANSLIAKFGEDEAMSVIELIDASYLIPLPRTQLDIPCTIRVGRTVSNDVFYRRRWNKSLQRYEHLIPQLKSRKLIARTSAWCEILRKDLSRGISGYTKRQGEVTNSFEPHVYAVPHSARIQWVWTWLG